MINSRAILAAAVCKELAGKPIICRIAAGQGSQGQCWSVYNNKKTIAWVAAVCIFFAAQPEGSAMKTMCMADIDILSSCSWVDPI